MDWRTTLIKRAENSFYSHITYDIFLSQSVHTPLSVLTVAANKEIKKQPGFTLK